VARKMAAASTTAPVEAVLFDMDGVLVSSDRISRLAARDVLKDLYAIDVDPEVFLAYTGMGEGVFLAGVAKAHGVEIDVDRTKAAFFETYLAKYCDGSENISFPGAVELVKACKNAGLKVAVASAADYIKVQGNLAAGRIDIGLFDAVISADQFVGKLKPNPDIFLAAGEALGVAPPRPLCGDRGCHRGDRGGAAGGHAGDWGVDDDVGGGSARSGVYAGYGEGLDWRHSAGRADQLKFLRIFSFGFIVSCRVPRIVQASERIAGPCEVKHRATRLSTCR